MRRLAALICLLASPSAFAANTFHAKYAAPETCPSSADFAAAVEQRLSGWRNAETEAEHNVVVDIRSADTGFHGSVSVDGAQPREVEGPRCDSVVRALALVTAVSLDPTAALSTEPTSEPVPPTPDPVTPPPTEAPRPPPPPGPPTREESESASFGFGAGGALLFGPAPSPLYGLQAHVELGTSTREFLLRLAGARSFTGTTPVGSGKAHFDLTQGELAGCYLPVRSSISLLTCLITDVGSIQAKGEPSQDLVETKTSTRLWVASGARLGFDFRLTGPLHVESSVGVLIPWRKQTYVFDSPTETENETLYESAPVALDLRLGLTVIFPTRDQE